MNRRTSSKLIVSILLGLCLAAMPAAAESINLLSLQEGTLPVVIPPTYSGWNAENVLDEDPASGWASAEGQAKNNVFVFEMVDPAVIESFEFDNAAVDDAGASARTVRVEVSTTSATSGFTPVLAVELVDKQGGQRFDATQRMPARWVRLTLVDNYGSESYSELFSFRGFGEKPARSVPAAVSGTYETSYSLFHLRQQGSALVGCYEYDAGLINGTIEGRVMKLTWKEGGGPDDTGPALMVFTPDGRSFRGFYWHKGNALGAPAGNWDGTKRSATVGSCPHWSGSVGGELKHSLETEKRARLYGIRFDFNSATIRDESRPVLDEVRDLLKEKADWHLTVEGHTDDVGAEDYNQTLSRQRAESVKAYLVAAGIQSDRLVAVGFGESRPVADNATELGRAQNRRVELVRE